MTDAAAAPVAPAIRPAFAPSPGTLNYVLAALLTVYTFNFIDRSLVGVLNEQIKNEFGVSDFWMGMLGGPTFAILYTFLGLPIGRLAERFNRVWIISAALVIWSVMTVLCGLAGQLPTGVHIALYLAVLAPVMLVFLWQKMFVSFFLVVAACAVSVLAVPWMAGMGFLAFGLMLMSRVGVGIGEAGCSPPSHSLLSDYFPPERRASALSVYALGIPIGAMLAAVGGGWLATNLHWRDAFIWLGLPGVLIGLIVVLTVREPPRGASEAHDGGEAAPDFSAVLKALLSKATFWNIALGCAVTSFVGYGVGQFLNSFFMRTHGLSPFEASIYFGVVAGLASAVGTFLGGFLSDRLAPRHPNVYGWLPGLCLVLAAPLYVLGLMAGSLPLLVACLVPAAILHYTYLGPTFATTQRLVEPRMRATASAILLFIVNLIGFAGGPPTIGALSDFLINNAYAAQGGVGVFAEVCKGASANVGACQSAKAQGLQLALVIGVAGYALGGLFYLFAARTVAKELRA